MPLTFSRLILHVTNLLHTAPPFPYHRTPHPTGLTIVTLNIRDCRVFGLLQAIQVVERGGFVVMLLTDNKIQSKSYSQN